MDERKIVEAILLVADEPIPAGLIGEVLERPRAEVEELLTDLATEYAAQDRGFVLRERGWRLAPLHQPGLRSVARALRAGPLERSTDRGRARGAGDRRLPATGLPYAGRRDPRGRVRRGRQNAAAEGPDPGVGARIGAGEPGAVQRELPSSSNGWGSTASRTCPR